MMDIYAEFATDELKEVEGVKVDLSPTSGIVVARVGNDRYNKMLTDLLDKHGDELGKDTPASRELDKEITLQVRAETILLGWWGLSYKGESLDYSIENAKTLLRVKDFRIKVMTEATKFDNYRVAQEEARGKD